MRALGPSLASLNFASGTVWHGPECVSYLPVFCSLIWYWVDLIELVLSFCMLSNGVRIEMSLFGYLKLWSATAKSSPQMVSKFLFGNFIALCRCTSSWYCYKCSERTAKTVGLLLELVHGVHAWLTSFSMRSLWSGTGVMLAEAFYKLSNIMNVVTIISLTFKLPMQMWNGILGGISIRPHVVINLDAPQNCGGSQWS